MTGAAASGFITRFFEAMLKECAGKKYPDLQSAVQACLDNMKETKQEVASDENKHVAIPAGEERDDGDALAKEGDGLAASTQNNSGTKSQEINESIIVALANAWHTLDWAQTDLILKPLRLETEGNHNTNSKTSLMVAMHKDKSMDLREVGKILQESFQISGTRLKTRMLVMRICDAVIRRAARLVATGIVAVLKKIDRDGYGSTSSGSRSRRMIIVLESSLYILHQIF